MALHYSYIKKIITVKGQEMYYCGDGMWFGRTSKADALEGLNSGKYQLWSVVNKQTGEELVDVKLDEFGQIIESVVEEVEKDESQQIQVQEVYEITNAEEEEMIGQTFESIDNLENYINEIASKARYCIKVWVKVSIPNTNGSDTYSFKCEAYKGSWLNLKNYCMQTLKSSIQCCQYSKELDQIPVYERLLTSCEESWGVSKPSDCYDYIPLNSIQKFTATKRVN